MKKVLLSFLSVITALAVVAVFVPSCEKSSDPDPSPSPEPEPEPEPEDPEVTAITLSPETLELTAGTVGSLKVTFVPSGTTAKLTWTSSNESVAKVSSTGKVTAVAEGTANITAKVTDNTSIKASATVTVTAAKIPVTSISFAVPSSGYSVAVGSTLNLYTAMTVTPDNATDKSVTWSTSDNSKAEVYLGVVTGKAAGKVTITATANDGSGVKGKVDVTTEYVFDDCSSLTGWNTGVGAPALDTQSYVTGNSSISVTHNGGAGLVIFVKTLSQGINAGSLTRETAYMVVNVYVSDASKLTNYLDNGKFQLGSGDNCDVADLGWSWRTIGEYANGGKGSGSWVNGWNKIEVPCCSPWSHVIGSGLNFSNIKYFRFFNWATTDFNGVVFKLDKVAVK